MGELITLGRSEDDKRPQIICPHCKKKILMKIKPFEKNVAKIMQSNCPLCGGVIFTGLLILAHPDLKGLIECIKLVVQTVNSKNKILL